MRILVTAPNDKIGSIVVRELMAPEFSVRVLAHEPGGLPEGILEQVEVVRGSADDAAILTQALQGVEALFWCVPAQPLEGMDAQSHYERFACAGYQAIRAAGTSRVVTISAAGNGLAGNRSPISALHAMEDILNQSGAAIRHVRCGWLMDNLLAEARSICEHGAIAYPVPGHIPIPMVAASDVADVALRWLVRRAWRGSNWLAVHGPEELTCNQAAAVIERILQRPVRYREISSEAYIRTLVTNGASVEYAYSMANLFTEFTRGVPRAEPRTGDFTSTTTLAAWVETVFIPLIESAGFSSKADTACISV